MSLYDALVQKETKLAVVGMGYVGMPLLFGFSEFVDVIGFDVSDEKVGRCKLGPAGQPDTPALASTHNILCTDDPAELQQAGFIVVAVPTPVKKDMTPDLGILERASAVVGSNLKPGAIVSYESTVYPGATEEVCIPILERASGLRCGVDFHVGYSPERINPGDKVNRLDTIVKIVSGTDAETTNTMRQVYSLVAKGGVHVAPSIKVAEAAKVAENSQRDINIAFVNELSMMFNAMGIDTLDVIEAMNTKWNALKFRPGLVGGHCIGVDPFYLTHKAAEYGYQSEIIMAGRKLNDSVGAYVANETVKLLSRIDKPMQKIKVAVLGYSFKENSDDARNTKVEDIVRGLEEYGLSPMVSDPYVHPQEVAHEYGRTLTSADEIKDVDCVVLAVGHDAYRAMDKRQWDGIFGETRERVLVDVKGTVDPALLQELGCVSWRL